MWFEKHVPIKPTIQLGGLITKLLPTTDKPAGVASVTTLGHPW